jgi:uncharacterized ferritin-like protein (DUF455 family)
MKMDNNEKKCYKLDITMRDDYHHVYVGEKALWSIFDDKIEVYEAGVHYTYPMCNVIFYRLLEEEEK